MSADHDKPIPPCGPAVLQTCEHAGSCPQEASHGYRRFARARVGQPGGKSWAALTDPEWFSQRSENRRLSRGFLRVR